MSEEVAGDGSVTLSRRQFWQRVLTVGESGWPPDTWVAAFVIDIDRFKAVNDVLGVAAGNAALEEFGRRVVHWGGPETLAVRSSGDGFIALVPGVSTLARAMAGARDLRDRLAAPMVLGEDIVSRSVRIGVSVGMVRDTGLDELVRQADDALEATAQSWTDSVHSYRPQMHARARALGQIELHLRDALRSDSLRVVYQPEVDLRTGTVLGVEALLRWRHPDLGPITPDDIIAVAERSDVIVELGHWVLTVACRQMARWQEALGNLDTVMRVNISPAHLIHESMPDLILEILADTGVAPERLCIEMTEVSGPPDVGRLRTVIDGLRAAGVTVAMDDFGVGHSSLVRLTTIPVDVIKLDRQFISGIADNPVNGAIVRLIVGLARELDLDVVAEGVEVSADVDFLLDAGCYRGQGHLIGEPTTAELITEVLRARRIDLPFARC